MKNKSTYNYGLGLLKIILCFAVIFRHYGNWNAINAIDIPFIYLRQIAVPIFMFMSFFFCRRIFLEPNFDVFKKRICRLAYPFYLWGILYYLFYQLCELIIKVPKTTIIDLMWQLLLGSSPRLNPPLWYLMDLIILTIIYWLIFKYMPKKYAFVCIWILAAFALVLQYSGINYNFFIGLPYDEMRQTLGRIMEMTPYVTLGISFGTTKLMDKINDCKLISFVVCLFLICFLAKYNVINNNELGFSYSGLWFIIASILIFIMAYLIPFGRAKLVTKIIKFISKYSMGIYCTHFGVGYVITKSKLLLNMNALCNGILIFLICLMLCMLISAIPFKYTKMLVE